MHLREALAAWARGVAGGAVWSGTALVVPAIAVIRDHQVALAIVLFAMETVLASAILRFRIARALHGMPFDTEASARLRAARGAAGTAAAFSLGSGGLVLVFFLAYDLQAAQLPAVAAALVPWITWMVAGLLAGAILDSFLAPVGSVAWLETSAAWQFRRIAAPAFAYLPGALLTAWMGTSQGFLWPWFVVRAFTDITALSPGAREQTRSVVFGLAQDNSGRHPGTPTVRRDGAPRSDV